MASKYAHCWGFNDERTKFIVKLNDDAPDGDYELTATCAGETRTANERFLGGGKIVVGVEIPLVEGEGVSASLKYKGKLTDTMWTKVPVTKCPHCGGDI